MAQPATRRSLCVALSLLLVGTIAVAVPATAHASDSIDAAAQTFGLRATRITTLTRTGEVTKELSSAAASAGTTTTAHVVYLPAGRYTVSASIRVANRVYLVADPGTEVVLTGRADQLLWFSLLSGAGVYGGTWDGAGHGSASVIGVADSHVWVSSAHLRNGGKHGVAGYRNSALSLSDLVVSGNRTDGVHLENSTLTAVRLQSTANLRNGVQLSSGSRGTISDSVLDRNGLAVSGSTTGKTGHGLGLASATATVSRTSLSLNRVCGISATGKSRLTLNSSSADGNGRHGLGSTAGLSATIVGSRFVGNGYNGILATGAGTEVDVSSSQISGSKQYGISMPSRSVVRLSQSAVTGSGKINIAASARSRLTLKQGNVIDAAASHGITLASRSTLSITGSDNQVRANGGNGLMLSDKGTSGRISASVRFSDNRGIGVVARKKAKLSRVPCTFAANKKSSAATSGGKIVSLRR